MCWPERPTNGNDCRFWTGAAGSATTTVGVCDEYIYISRQPFVQHASSYVVVQHPFRHGYETEYPGWFLNEGEFLGFAQEIGLTLVREFLIQERPRVPNAPEQADYRGFLFAVPGRADGDSGRLRR